MMEARIVSSIGFDFIDRGVFDVSTDKGIDDLLCDFEVLNTELNADYPQMSVFCNKYDITEMVRNLHKYSDDEVVNKIKNEYSLPI